MPAISVPDPIATYIVYAVFLGLCFGQWVIGRLVPPRYTLSNKRWNRSSPRYWCKPLEEHSMNDLLPVPLPPLAAARLGAVALQPASPPPVCHRCSTVATVSWPRHATDDEREAHWAALEAHIRSQPNLFDDQNAHYTADREQPVTKAVFGCDEHRVDDMTLLHAVDCGGHGACECGGSNG